MALAVVNYPALSEIDFRWIRSIRERYDRLFYKIVDSLTRHIQKVSEEFEGSLLPPSTK